MTINDGPIELVPRLVIENLTEVGIYVDVQAIFLTEMTSGQRLRKQTCVTYFGSGRDAKSSGILTPGQGQARH
jgi:hypothetical protein